MRNTSIYIILVEKFVRKRSLRGSRRGWEIILEWILGKWRVWIGCIWPNESSGSIESGEIS
jgi:hypothetical protein